MLYYIKKKVTNGNRTLVSCVVLRHLSPCATTRFSKNNLTKGYINNFINFEWIFSKIAEHGTQISLFKYSPGRVLYYKNTLLKSVIHNSRTLLVSRMEQIVYGSDDRSTVFSETGHEATNRLSVLGLR